MTIEKTAGPPRGRETVGRATNASSTALRLVRKAERLMGARQYARAIDAFTRALDAGSSALTSLLRLAEAHGRLGQWPEALTAVDRFIRKFPHDRSGWEVALQLAEGAGDQSRALTAVEELLRISPRHIRAHVTLGEIHLRNGNISAARRTYDRLVSLDPESPSHHFHKALVCQHQSNLELAVQEFIQAIWLDPEGPLADPARCFLQDLDVMQLNVISTLAAEDMVFRTRLSRNCQEAARSRGFTLSPMGEELLEEFCETEMAHQSGPERISQYH